MTATVQRDIEKLLTERIEAGNERGIQVSVRRHGEVLVDLALGTADPQTDRPMTPDTPVFGWSAAKGATATVIHLLVQRGELADDTRIADIWPEFGAHGKDEVTIAHVLTHTAGIPGVPMDATVEQFADWEHMCAVTAAAEPWWEPGTQTGYHSYTFGFILGEVVRRITGRPISEVWCTDVAEPLGIADEFYLGMPAGEQHRLARLEDAPAPPMNPDDFPPDLPMFRTGPMTLVPRAELGNRPDFVAATVPAVGVMTARSITALYDALSTGRVLEPERLATVTAPAFTGTDAIFGNEATWGLGYSLGIPAEPGDPTLSVFGMGGSGGTHAWADTATGVSFGLTKNRMSMTDDVGLEIIDLVRRSLP